MSFWDADGNELPVVIHIGIAQVKQPSMTSERSDVVSTKTSVIMTNLQ